MYGDSSNLLHTDLSFELWTLTPPAYGRSLSFNVWPTFPTHSFKPHHILQIRNTSSSSRFMCGDLGLRSKTMDSPSSHTFPLESTCKSYFKTLYTCVCDWVTVLYGRKLTEHWKEVIMDKIKILLKKILMPFLPNPHCSHPRRAVLGSQVDTGIHLGNLSPAFCSCPPPRTCQQGS